MTSRNAPVNALPCFAPPPFASTHKRPAERLEWRPHMTVCAYSRGVGMWGLGEGGGVCRSSCLCCFVDGAQEADRLDGVACPDGGRGAVVEGTDDVPPMVEVAGVADRQRCRGAAADLPAGSRWGRDVPDLPPLHAALPELDDPGGQPQHDRRRRAGRGGGRRADEPQCPRGE